MAIMRFSIGEGKDYPDRELFEESVPKDTTQPYVGTEFLRDGTTRTPGVWVAIVKDDTWAGGRHDEGTVVEQQHGVEERKPQASPVVEAFIERKFIVNGIPEFVPKLHKLPLGETILSKAGAMEVHEETIKGKQELAAHDAISREDNS